ncbi:PREDICTED: protein ENHANCED DISEASE RESISTANCE 2-like [Tarenaya hassleriana]|uniref:protein ENHANCED DISEASE RESISTANCE 2-like n=1 Tax=Tarenaya hassleriana TaxID=28532 RepID=UPI00053C62DD|nr:PREDICTED: protein ENHANCED DISEASE RESISTANCE 2-like [Tarenaya hassleriana]
MGVSQTDGRMEGWLYTIRQNRFGLQFSRKRYFVLRDNNLTSYKSVPSADNEEPDRRASLDSCIRVNDNGRESFHRKILFIFTLYNTSNHSDQLKLGASSPEEAAKWIRSLQDASLKGSPFPDCDFVSHSERGLVRLDVSKRSRRKNSVDWTNYTSTNTNYSSVNPEVTAPDVIAPSPWKIFGCQNGLRLFKEAKDWDSRGRHWDDHAAIMAVGVIDGTSEEIFNTLMSLGPLRSEWDFCFYRGSVVEHLDGHTDIIYQQLYSDWLPWGMKPRDLLLRRYWRREDDGTYVILCHSVYHKKCPPGKGYVRACVKSGGYVVTPMNNGTQSMVKHMIAIDWRSWNLYMRPSSARSITIRMVERVAALREMFRAKHGQFFSNLSSGDFMTTKTLSKNKTRAVSFEGNKLDEVVKSEVTIMAGEEAEKTSSPRPSFMELNDMSDEFFDVLEPHESSGFDSFIRDTSPQGPQLKLPSAAGLVKKLQDLAVQKKGYVDLQEVAMEENVTYLYGATLQKDPSFSAPCSWATADPSTFLIRGSNYLKDHQKEKAKGTMMQMMGADWISSDKREDDLGGRLGGIVQDFAAEGRPEFFFIVNIQVPGSAMYTLAMYYMLNTPLEENPLLHGFVNGDDAYRNSRFKLIPHISKGSWIVKQSVGKKACLLGQALETRYVRGKNYLELDIDVGSSTVARGVTNLVLGYLNNLVIEMAFLIQANTEEELPEVLLGTCRLNYLDVSKSVRER